MIRIVDCGLGNIQAFRNVFKRLNIAALTATTAAELEDATKVILPGVGHFDRAMERLTQSGMRGKLEELVLAKGVPVLGVCVGMQIMTQSSDEGMLPGLGWIEGHVRGFAALELARVLPVPHMGWNDVRPVAANRLFSQLETAAQFYFLHSFYVECAQDDDIMAISHYGKDFSSAVRRGNVFGVQFHPEKSHHFGTRLLQNFAEL